MRRFVALLAVLVGMGVGGALAPPVAAEPAEQPLALGEIETIRVQRPRSDLKPGPLGGRRQPRGWVVRLHGVRAETVCPSPAVGDGRVYVGGGLTSTRLHAFDARSGKRLWSATLHDNGPSTVAVTPDRVVVNTESCTTYGIEPRTGRVAWSRLLGPHVAAAPAVVDGHVITAHHSMRSGCRLTAMDLGDGEIAWDRPLPLDAVGAPVYRGGRLFVTSQEGTLTCFSLRGDRLWGRRLHAASAPWAAPGALYVADGDAGVARLDPTTGDTAWYAPLRSWTGLARDTVTVPADLLREDVTLDLLLGWSTDPPRPVVVDGLCVFASGGVLHVFDAETGELVRRLRLPAGRRFFAPPAVLGSCLLYATQEGLLFRVDPATGGVERAVDLGRRVDSQPVVAEGYVYVATGDLLVAVRWGERDGPSWPQWSGSAARSR